MIGYLIGAAALVGGTMMVRKYLHSRPVTFAYDGATYVRHPDGSFTSPEGAPVISPELEKVRAHWDEMNGGDSSSHDGGDGGGGD